MSWVLFSILAVIVWAVVNTIDKYILTKLIKKPIIPVIFVGVIGLIGSVFVYFIRGFSELSYVNIGLAIVAGIFYILMTIFYFKAVKIEEISRVIPLFHLTPLFVLILALIFLGEIFTPIKYLGIFLLMIGAILISSKWPLKINFGRAFWFMVLSSFTLSINAVITKYLLNFADFWTIFSYIRIGTFIAVIPLFYINYKDIMSLAKRPLGFVVLTESLNLVAVLFITIAMSIGFVTLVNALSATPPFFVLVFTVMLSIFYPKILKEEISKKTVLMKLIAIILMFIGVVLII